MPLRLNDPDRSRLRHLARSTRDARLLRRIQALLDLDAGDGPEQVARRYQVVRSTIYNWIRRCQRHGPSETALRDQPRSGRPRSPQRRVHDGLDATLPGA